MDATAGASPEMPKPRPGCIVYMLGGRQEAVIESYEDVTKRVEEAEPRERIELTGYSDFATTDKRVIQRLHILTATVFLVEEINDAFQEGWEEERMAAAERAQRGVVIDDPDVLSLLLGLRRR